MSHPLFQEPAISTPPRDPGAVRRGEVVMLWDPRGSRYLKKIFYVLSNDRFHANGRDEVQLVEIERPFRPVVTMRSRVKKVGYKPSKLADFAGGMRDLMSIGASDDVGSELSRNGCVLELPVDFSDGTAYKMRMATVASRPLTWTSYSLLFFCDISSGESVEGDYSLKQPGAAGLSGGSFVKARIWHVRAEEAEGYNRDRVRPRHLHPDDKVGLGSSLDAGLELGLQAAWAS
jgi:hypothetical protein